VAELVAADHDELLERLRLLLRPTHEEMQAAGLLSMEEAARRIGCASSDLGKWLGRDRLSAHVVQNPATAERVERLVRKWLKRRPERALVTDCDSPLETRTQLQQALMPLVIPASDRLSGWTRPQMAALLGIPSSAFNSWLNGTGYGTCAVNWARGTAASVEEAVDEAVRMLLLRRAADARGAEAAAEAARGDAGVTLSDIGVSLRAQLQAFMARHGYNQTQIALRLETCASQMCNWINGRCNSAKIDARVSALLAAEAAGQPLAMGQEPIADAAEPSRQAQVLAFTATEAAAETAAEAAAETAAEAGAEAEAAEVAEEVEEVQEAGKAAAAAAAEAQPERLGGVVEGAAGGATRSQEAPPQGWAWPREGSWIEVEVLQESATEAEWVPAQVKAMHLDGRFLVAIGGADPFDDWLGWQDEGKDWRRTKATKATVVGDPSHARAESPASTSTDSSVATAAATAAAAAATAAATAATAAAAAPASTAAAEVTQLVDEPNLLPGWSAWLHVTANGRRYKSYWGPAGERAVSQAAMRRAAGCEATSPATPAAAKPPSPAAAAKQPAAMPRGDTAGSPPDPLEPKSAKGRCVLIPHSMWPDYECTENGGAGWSGVIKTCDRSGIAKVRFDNATDDEGRPYPDEHVRLSDLRPLS